MVIHPFIIVTAVTQFISSSSSLLVMPLNLALLGDVLGGETSVNVQWRNNLMAQAWSIAHSTATWEGANDKETEEGNADNDPANSW